MNRPASKHFPLHELITLRGDSEKRVADAFVGCTLKEFNDELIATDWTVCPKEQFFCDQMIFDVCVSGNGLKSYQYAGESIRETFKRLWREIRLYYKKQNY